MQVNSKLSGYISNFEVNLKFTFGQMKETRKNSSRLHHPDFIQTEAKMMNK